MSAFRQIYINRESDRGATADFIKNVLSVYTHSMTTIYLSLIAQVAISTFYMKSPVKKGSVLINKEDKEAIFIYWSEL